MIAQDTGYVAADAERDFRRLRRQRRWSGLATKLRLAAGTCTQLVSFADVTVGLGVTVQYDLGLQTVELDTIVGSVGKVRDFDCGFRPGRRASACSRLRRATYSAARPCEPRACSH